MRLKESYENSCTSEPVVIVKQGESGLFDLTIYFTFNFSKHQIYDFLYKLCLIYYFDNISNFLKEIKNTVFADFQFRKQGLEF